MRPLRFALTVLANRRGTVPRPSWCTYLVSYRCNARCGMCDSWRIKPGSELTPDQVRTVFGKIGPLEVVRLTGGEPFLRPDFFELALAVFEKSTPSVLHVTTNGSFPDRVAEFVQSFPRPRQLRFMVSLDGLPEAHDASRGKKVTFAIAEQTISTLAKLRDRMGCAVSINHTVISAQSIEDHAGLVEWFAPIGVEVYPVVAYADSAMYGRTRLGTRASDLIDGRSYPLYEGLKDADVVGFVRQQLEHARQLPDRMFRIGKSYYMRGLLERLEGGDGPRLGSKCVALRSHLRLLPDGRVPVCQFNTETVGNLLTESFDEVWHGTPARDQRQWVDDCPGCWAECEVMPNALFTGELLFHLR